MKIAIVGPSHPYKGGIVQQTTELAHRLAKAGHDVELVAWKSQYPVRLYPGSLLPLDQPELPLFPNTSHGLAWNKPWTWIATGNRLRTCDLVIFVWFVPTFHGVIYRVIRSRLKNAATVAICHNVLQHDPRPGDKQLARGFFMRVDRLVVHTSEQATIAHSLTHRQVTVTALPTFVPGWSETGSRHPTGLRRRVLFFGIVRDYKGLDTLLSALAKTEHIDLTIAGEFWNNREQYEELIKNLGLTKRVTIHSGYIAAEAIPKLFADADALVLPYLSATGTTNVQVGFAYGLPVICSDISALAEQVEDGVNGLLFRAGDADDLADKLQQFYTSGVHVRLQAHIPAVEIDAVWQKYIENVVGSV